MSDGDLWQDLESLRQQKAQYETVLSDLMRTLGVETNPLLKAQWMQEIEETRAALNRVNRDLQRTVQGLYDKLVDVDYSEQVSIFRNCPATQPAHAYLVHGPRMYGHYWLLKRLSLVLTRQKIDHRIYRFDMDNDVLSLGVSELWRQLGAQLGADPFPPISDSPSDAEIEACANAVARRIATQLQTQWVLLVLKNVELMTTAGNFPDQNLVEKLWVPVAKQVQAALSTQVPGKLVLFAVYQLPEPPSWPEPAAGITCQPVALRLDRKFAPADVRDAVKAVQDWLPANLEVDEMVTQILQASDGGVPESVARQIFKRCGTTYKGEQWASLL